jgi:hypothetical protein
MDILKPGALIALILATAACSDTATSSLDGLPPSLKGNANLGLEAFQAECASCHSAGDGFDLAFFGFPDTTIVRRALGHVEMPTALDIVAHIRSMNPAQSDRNAHVFQPQGRILVTDQAFSFELFGIDRWPETLTTQDLLEIDPREVLVALPLPKWSVEGSNVDWMPEVGLSTDVLTFMDGDLALEAYRSVPNEENVLQLILALRIGVADPRNPTAPCIFFSEQRTVEHERCFENQRWIATLAAQHMLRRGTNYLHPLAHDAFWAVGFTARDAVVHNPEVPFENGLEIWANWTWLGWMFEPANHSSFYGAQGLVGLKLNRHATFMILRSQVARPAGSSRPYEDLSHAAAFAPDHWVGSAVAFSLRNLVERLESGDVPTKFGQDETVAELRMRVQGAFERAAYRDPTATEKLRVLKNRVLELLPTD